MKGTKKAGDKKIAKGRKNGKGHAEGRIERRTPSEASGVDDKDLLAPDEGKFLLKVARGAIETYLKTGQRPDIRPQDVPTRRLTMDGACFVTLYKGKGKALRGCIGSLEASRPLVMDVADNAMNSAFGDPRFPPLRPDELKDIAIEISVLTPPRKLEVSSADDLLKSLVQRKHGLIIKKGWARATFLPVVWDELKKKEDFLSELCQKAGLSPDEWKDTEGMEFFVYQAQEFEE
jgi:AmmeMemoRadiSam system protein A